MYIIRYITLITEVLTQLVLFIDPSSVDKKMWRVITVC